MRVAAQAHEARAILAAMRDVAAIGRMLTEADRASLVAAGHWMFALDEPIDVDRLAAMTPSLLAAAVPDARLRDEAARFLTVMAFVDGTLDAAKMARVLAYAVALGGRAEYVDDVAVAARGGLAWALGHMILANMASITNRPWAADADVMAWMLPYRGAHAAPTLAARYRALVALPAGPSGAPSRPFRAQRLHPARRAGRAQRDLLDAARLDSRHLRLRHHAARASCWSRPSFVESRCGAVVRLEFGFPVARPFVCECPMIPAMLRFHIPLIKPDVRISRIRLSDRRSRFRPRKVARPLRQPDEVDRRDAPGAPDLRLHPAGDLLLASRREAQRRRQVRPRRHGPGRVPARLGARRAHGRRPLRPRLGLLVVGQSALDGLRGRVLR